MVSAENCSVLSWDKQPHAYGRQNCWLCGLSFGEGASCFHISAKYVFLKDTSFQPLQWARLPSARSWILDFTPLPASFQLLPPEPGDVLMAAAGRKAESERLGAGVGQNALSSEVREGGLFPRCLLTLLQPCQSAAAAGSAGDPIAGGGCCPCPHCTQQRAKRNGAPNAHGSICISRAPGEDV